MQKRGKLEKNDIQFENAKKFMTLEMPGIEPGAFHMQSERATTALHPHTKFKRSFRFVISNLILYKTNCRIEYSYQYFHFGDNVILLRTFCLLIK